MKYKVGDKVRIKSLDWYNENKDEEDNVPLIETTNSDYNFVEVMQGFCGKVMTILNVNSCYYDMAEDNGVYFWTDEMIEELVEEKNKSNIIEDAKTYWDSIKDAWICPEGYIFKDENGNVINATKIVLEKKKKEYPKTYEECCEILGVDTDNFLAITSCYEGEVETTDYELGLLSKFISLWRLRVCRDAYWKLAGERMGLGKPWENNDCEVVYSICIDGDKIDKRDDYFGASYTFEFPIREMRDSFYDNFKELIEKCKELL